MLVRLGVDATKPCTKYGEPPSAFFKAHGALVAGQLARAVLFRQRTATRLARFLWPPRRPPPFPRNRAGRARRWMGPRRRHLRKTLRYVDLIQRTFRGFRSRRHVAALVAALVANRREAAEAAETARVALIPRPATADGDEEVLTMAEAVACEEAAETAAALSAANDGREEWEECWDEATGAAYYIHYQTGESVWEKPTSS